MHVRIIDETECDSRSTAADPSPADEFTDSPSADLCSDAAADLGSSKLSAATNADRFAAAQLSTATNAAAGPASASDDEPKSAASIVAPTAAAAIFSGNTIEPADGENRMPAE